jgi:hypothetical protein
VALTTPSAKRGSPSRSIPGELAVEMMRWLEARSAKQAQMGGHNECPPDPPANPDRTYVLGERQRFDAMLVDALASWNT